MQNFWKLLEESIIVQGLVTLSLVGAVIYLSVLGKEIPELLNNATMLALGFYFGTKSQQILRGVVRKKGM